MNEEVEGRKGWRMLTNGPVEIHAINPGDTVRVWDANTQELLMSYKAKASVEAGAEVVFSVENE